MTDRPAKAGPAKARPAKAKEPPKSWGGVARRGSKVIAHRDPDRPTRPGRPAPRPKPVAEATDALREPRRPDKPRVAPLPPSSRPPFRPPTVRGAKGPRKAKPTAPRAPLPPRPIAAEDLGTSLTRAVGARQVARARADLDAAARAYDAERFDEALRLTRRLASAAPDVPEVRELNGLALYRLGRWPAAIVELEAFRALTGSAEEDHVLADCYRAMRRWRDVDELWEELRYVSPSPEVVNEGRIVVAGSLADRGDLSGAARLLEKGWRIPARPRVHHLRRAYALADLYERSGQAVRARELFRWILGVDAQFADVPERLRSL
jgi:hypothetical protein